MAKIKHNILVKPTWFIDKDDSKMYDIERQNYVMKSNFLKLENKVDNKQYDAITEILFHGLNINSLFLNKTMFDEYHNIKIDSDIEKIILNLFANDELNFKSIYDLTCTEVTRLLKKISIYVHLELQKTNVYIKNEIIHDLSCNYLLLDNNQSISIYKNTYSEDYVFGTYCEKITEIKGNDQKNKYSKFLEEYNSRQNIIKITEHNILGVNHCNKKNDNIFSLINSILTLNKWFNNKLKFNVNIVQDINKLNTNSNFNMYFS
jgi:hypothetical protein